MDKIYLTSFTREDFKIQELIIGDQIYSLNFFSDSSSWIKQMKITKKGTCLVITIEKNWYNTQPSGDIIAKLCEECQKAHVEWPFKEVLFKLV
jgi:hypothetical protein